MEKIFIIDSKELKCIINRKAKKNIIFRFQNRELHISIPKRFTFKELKKIIESKKEWIYEKLEYINSEVENNFFFLGIDFKNKEDLINYCNENYNMKNDDFYSIADKIYKERLDKLTKHTGLYPEKIRIKKLKTAWGICYRNRSITLNLLLLCCPINVIDYVIIHELSHLKHMNHSSNFWNEVTIFSPQFKESKAWLKVNGTKIFHQNYL